MKTKNLLLGGIAGGITDFLLGWLFYGFLLKDVFPASDDNMNMLFIFLGCMTYGFIVAYIYSCVANVSSIATGLKVGIILGVLMGLYGNFFMYSMRPVDYQLFIIDVITITVMTAIVGVVVSLVNGKVKQDN